jgi:hypothetical protein
MIIPVLRTLLHARTRLAEALFSSVQRRVLALFFGHPERRFQSAEVIRLVQGGTGGVHRELRRLETAGWLTAERVGNQKHYQANRACPCFPELEGLVAKTLVARAPGGAAILRTESKAAPRRQGAPSPGPREEPGNGPHAPPKDDWKVW